MGLSGNKGEWSEVYALFKLLCDGALFSGDEDLNKIESIFYPIVKVIRSENFRNLEYSIDGEVIVISSGEEHIRISISEFQRYSILLFDRIKASSGVFQIPEMETFLHEIQCQTLKAKSSKKTDITIVIHDLRINRDAELGFSIKSQLGGDSTLLNAGKTTNFIYRIVDTALTQTQIDSINAIDTRSKIRDRIEAIQNLGGTLEFVGLEQGIFRNNLVLIDSLLPNILSEIVLLFFGSNSSKISELTAIVNNRNPLRYDKQYSHTFYEYKMKRFLTDIAVGMMPGKVWDGQYDATGGYLIVKEDGEVLCYHMYNKNQFENYLFANTKLETASSTRHDFGKIYKDADSLFIKLNLQIRFI